MIDPDSHAAFVLRNAREEAKAALETAIRELERGNGILVRSREQIETQTRRIEEITAALGEPVRVFELD